MRKLLVALILVLCFLPLMAEAMIMVSDNPKEKTILEDIHDLLTDIYDNEVFCQSIYETKGYPFRVYPKSGKKYPSNIPVILNGRFAKNSVKVRIWDITNTQNPIFFRKVDFVYQYYNQELRYNLHLKNGHKYQVKVYVNGRLVVSHWFIQIIDQDDNFIPPLPRLNNDPHD